MNYEEALAYIHSINWRGSRPGLSRIRELLSALGNPEKQLSCIHIAGTNGKGSVSAMLDSILRKAGYRVGLFTSPYVERFNERICFGGEPISDGDLAELTGKLAPLAEAMSDPPTEFELITALGFLYFAEKQCDLVVLETGMGGRLDSTNAIEEPLLSIVTGVALDHTAFLGDTVEKIAAEKAGIIKKGAPALYGGDTPSVREVLAAKAAAMGAEFFVVDRSHLVVRRADLAGSVVDYDGFSNLFLPLLGLYQPRNLATAVTAIGLLRQRGLSVSDEAVREGLAGVRWKARFELLARDPVFVFDGAHNQQGVEAACEAIGYYFADKRPLLLTGVMADKEYEKMAELLVPCVGKVFTVRPDNPRALEAEALAETYRRLGAEAEAYPDMEGALTASLEAAVREGRPVVALGSLYMYRELKTTLSRMLPYADRKHRKL